MPKKLPENKDASTRIIFDGELKHKIEYLKNYYGIRNSTDILRLLITLKYDELHKNPIN